MGVTYVKYVKSHHFLFPQLRLWNHQPDSSPPSRKTGSICCTERCAQDALVPGSTTSSTARAHAPGIGGMPWQVLAHLLMLDQLMDDIELKYGETRIILAWMPWQCSWNLSQSSWHQEMNRKEKIFDAYDDPVRMQAQQFERVPRPRF